MFISPAWAQGAPAPGGGGILLQLLPFILIFAIMYFLIIRPQQKRIRDHREMVSNIRRGDEVITAGGVKGRVTKVVSDEELEVEIAKEVRVRLVRSTVSHVLAKGEPVKDAASS